MLISTSFLEDTFGSSLSGGVGLGVVIGLANVKRRSVMGGVPRMRSRLVLVGRRGFAHGAAGRCPAGEAGE